MKNLILKFFIEDYCTITLLNLTFIFLFILEFFRSDHVHQTQDLGRLRRNGGSDLAQIQTRDLKICQHGTSLKMSDDIV